MYPLPAGYPPSPRRTKVREHLKLWQDQQRKGLDDPIPSQTPQSLDSVPNSVTQSGEDDTFSHVVRDTDMEQGDDFGHADLGPTAELVDTTGTDQRYLKQGDVVQLRFSDPSQKTEVPQD